MAEIVGSALPFSVLFDKLATEEVKNFLRPKKVINKLLEKLEVSLLSANQLLDVAEEKQIEDEMVEKWLNELKDVVYKASELGDKIKTEALRRNLEGHQSASNITKMFTKLCSNLWNLCSNLLSSFDNDVEDELEEILSSLEHLLSQKDAPGLVPPGTGRSNDSGVTPATQPEGHQSATQKDALGLVPPGTGRSNDSGVTPATQPEGHQSATQMDALGLVPPGTGRSNDSGVTPATQLEGHQPARNKTTKMFKFFSKKSFHNYVIDELEEILSLLEPLLSRKDELGLKRRSNYSDVTPAVRFRATPVADESGFCGREDIKETIIRLLLSAEVGGDKVSVIPVIGPGGIGKTTLAQIIYHHPDVEKHFPKEDRAWITVSTEFDLLAIAKRIIGKFSSSSQIHGDDDPQELLFNLKDALKGKRFLVLDDVWSENRDEWDNLKSCFQSGNKIIVTTRSSRVASIAAPNQQHHFLPELPEEDCRRLFAKTVFTGDQDRDAHPDLQEIGKKIVEKCKGLPLSVKSVGGILRGNRDAVKWESILKNSVWELLQQNNKNIIPSLWLSYRYLPSEIKPCFAYCCIFPQDYRFKKEVVVRLWMAEGLLKNEAGKREITMEEVGKRYFEELISRSLFQRSSDDDDEETIMMHDLVHDLAMYVSGKFCFWMDKDKILHDLPCETRHLSYNLAIEDAKQFQGLSKAKRLHTFVGFQVELYGDDKLDLLKVLEEVSVEGACLRVLSLSAYYKIDSLRDSVGKLKHLRYLNLSYTAVRELPHSVGTLYNLQTLLLSGCGKLTRLPSNLGSLINLHHLDTSDSPLKEMPPNMCNLKKLHTLTDFVLGKQSGSSIRDLGVLEDLHGRIRVSGLKNVSNVDDALKANLKNKKNLTKLALEWEGQSDEWEEGQSDEWEGQSDEWEEGQSDEREEGQSDEREGQSDEREEGQSDEWEEGQSDERDSRHEEKVLDALQPHHNLKELFISKRDSRHEEKVLDALQPHHNLKELFISEYGGTSFPDWLGDSLFSKIERMHLNGCQDCRFLPSLGRLASLKELKMEGFHKLETIDDGFYGNDSPFKSLEVLHFANMPEWKRWSVIEVPRLKRLKLSGCPKLVGSLPNSNTVANLDIYLCESLDFPANQLYPSLESLQIQRSCCSIKRLSLEHLPKLNELDLVELECLVELTGKSTNELERLSIKNCPKLEFGGNGCYGSLKRLHIEKCHALKSIPLDYFPKLNWFTLEKLACLVELSGESTNELKWLSIKKCPRLEFMGNGCYGSLEELEIQICLDLKSIPLDYFPKLSDLTLRSCKGFESFTFAEEPHLVLKSLYLWDLPKFVSFPEGGLPAPNLKDFRIEECENLRSLPQQMHRLLPSLNTLWLSDCGEIESRPEGGLPSNLESLRILGCKKLAAQIMHWDLQVTCLKSLQIDGCGEELLDSFPPEWLLPTSLTSLWICNFRGLKTLNIHAFQHLSIQAFIIENCDELQCLPEESLPNSLSSLEIYSCPLLGQRYRKETGEGWHKISHIPYVEISNI